jgi:hypothetical protein
VPVLLLYLCLAVYVYVDSELLLLPLLLPVQ